MIPFFFILLLHITYLFYIHHRLSIEEGDEEGEDGQGHDDGERDTIDSSSASSISAASVVDVAPAPLPAVAGGGLGPITYHHRAPHQASVWGGAGRGGGGEVRAI